MLLGRMCHQIGDYMSLFDWIGSIFAPATKLVDDLHFSGEEEAAAKAKMAELKNKLAEIEAKVATRTLELQSQIIEANAKVAVAEQEHGNLYTKSVRPTIMLASFIMLTLMGFGLMPYNETIAYVYAGFLGVYTSLRSLVDKKK